MPKHFESFLAPRLQDYLAYRQGLGYRDDVLESRLASLDRYVLQKAVDLRCLTPLFFLTMRRELTGSPRTVNAVLSAARGFFDFLMRQQLCPENPLGDIPARQEFAYIPFIFAPDEVEGLLGAVQKTIRKDQRYFLTDLALYLAILLLARCGLRLSEPTRLRLSHYRPDELTIYIEKTKFAKDRLLPVPYPVAREIENYLVARRALADDDRNAFLLSGVGPRPLSDRQIYRLFQQALRDIGQGETARYTIANTTFGAPTPHSLRHSFAVNTLKAIKARGGSPQNALPVLSAYLGHRKYRYTAIYLKVLDAEQRQGLVDFAIMRQQDL